MDLMYESEDFLSHYQGDTTPEWSVGSVLSRHKREQELDYVPSPHDIKFYLIFLLEWVLLVFGLAGNGLLVLMFARHKALRSSTNIYVLSLAAADLLVCLSCPGVMIVKDITGTWPLGLTACKFSQATMEFSTCASVLTLTVVSLERYYAIMHPIDRHLSTQRFSVVANIVIWVVAMLFAVPKFIYSDIFQYVSSVSVCKFDETNKISQIIALFNFFVLYVFPFCIVCFVYVTISRKLKQSMIKSTGSHSTTGLNSLMKNKVARMVLVLTAIFFVGFLPYNILRLMVFFFGGKGAYVHDAYCFGCLHFFLNPIALYVFCDTFRKYYNSYLFCSCVPWSRLTITFKSQDQSDQQETNATTTTASANDMPLATIRSESV